MSKHLARPKRFIFKRVLLVLFILFSLTAFGFYAWLSYIEGELHREIEVLKKVEKVLSPPKSYQDPVNILILGSDSRYQKDRGRSDTLIVMNINFQKDKVYLVSIPRDMRVFIPGEGLNKINAAYAFGGPELSIRTVENFTGIQLNHYVEIDFKGFKKMVDALGGIVVEVKEPIIDRSREYRMYIPKGRQRMNGSLALNYVRYRHGDTDFKRAERQQNFLLALLDNALKWESVWRLPSLVEIFAQNSTTDLRKAEMLKLANFLRKLKRQNIETLTLPGKTGMLGGVSYAFPNREGIDLIFEKIAEGKSLKSVKKAVESGKILANDDEEITVALLNGSGRSGLATIAREKLRGRGFSVVRLGNADRFDYTKTQILTNADSKDKALKVKRVLYGEAITKTTSRYLEADVVVILGKDYWAFEERWE